jgi:RND family efflux transporter MFP subunit
MFLHKTAMRHPASPPIKALALAWLAAALLLFATIQAPQAMAAEAALLAAPAKVGDGRAASSHDAVVQAVRQTVMAAQVSGAVIALNVKVGDAVKAGQVLLKLDASAANQLAAAGAAQAQALRAAMALASKDFERQQQLFQKNYISQAALERAEADFKATQATLNAQLAQAGAALTQTGLHTVRAPYDAVVADVAVALGDMALPGRPLLTLYDPAALRVSANLPQRLASQLSANSLARVELPGLPARPELQGLRLQLLPTADSGTHTVELRADLPLASKGKAQTLSPGMSVKLWLPLGGSGEASEGKNLSVPLSAVVRRAEMTGLYVLDAQQRPLLRQVRLGAIQGDRVEVLAGLMAGEAVVNNAQAAARGH